jgi:DNA-binding response OmpR family regulator
MDNSNKPHILVVEDERPMSLALKEKFEREGFEVLIESNGRQALKKAIELKPDVILLDILLPGIDGMTMLKELRNDEWGKNVPVIILSNLSDDEKLKESVALNAANYLVKSNWMINDVVEQVRQCLNQDGRPAAEV